MVLCTPLLIIQYAWFRGWLDQPSNNTLDIKNIVGAIQSRIELWLFTNQIFCKQSQRNFSELKFMKKDHYVGITKVLWLEPTKSKYFFQETNMERTRHDDYVDRSVCSIFKISCCLPYSNLKRGKNRFLILQYFYRYFLQYIYSF